MGIAIGFGTLIKETASRTLATGRRIPTVRVAVTHKMYRFDR